LLDSKVLGCFQGDDGHVSIVPVNPAGELDMIKLEEWAATRGSATPHSLTILVLKAIVEHDIRRPK
jgi:hypothetical protein